MDIKKIAERLKFHAVDTTALLTASNPIFSALEVTACGMSDELSIHARLLATGTAYAGIGTLFRMGRDFSRRIFEINDQTKERTQGIHDTLYAMGFNLLISPPMYILAGARSLKEIAAGTALGVGFGLAGGWPMGYAIDVFSDLTGLQKSERKSYPEIIRKQKSKIKKGLAVSLTLGSIALMSGIYALTPDKQEPINKEIPAIHEVVKNARENRSYSLEKII